MNSKLYLFISVMIVFSISLCSANINEYNGIIGNETNPPENTIIDNNLSEYYNIPIATGNDTIYFYKYNYWYDYDDFFNLPSEVFMYNEYPTSLGNNNKRTTTEVPISSTIIILNIAIIGIVFYITKK